MSCTEVVISFSFYAIISVHVKDLYCSCNGAGSAKCLNYCRCHCWLILWWHDMSRLDSLSNCPLSNIHQSITKWSCHYLKLSRPDVINTWSFHYLKLSRPDVINTWSCHYLKFSRSEVINTWSCHCMKLSRPVFSLPQVVTCIAPESCRDESQLIVI